MRVRVDFSLKFEASAKSFLPSYWYCSLIQFIICVDVFNVKTIYRRSFLTPTRLLDSERKARRFGGLSHFSANVRIEENDI